MPIGSPLMKRDPQETDYLLKAYQVHRHHNLMQLIEMKACMKRAKGQNEDFEKHIINQIETATENKKTILRRISHIKLLTQSKGEKHWIITTPEGQLGWVPSENQYVECFISKPPSNSDLAKLLELCPFIQTLNMALTIRKYECHPPTPKTTEA